LLEEDEENKKCVLCARHRPVLAIESDDQMKNLPDRMLTPFVKELRNDFRHKYEYLKYIHVTTKFITPCKCKLHIHEYCLTARVIKNHKIYC